MRAARTILAAALAVATITGCSTQTQEGSVTSSTATGGAQAALKTCQLFDPATVDGLDASALAAAKVNGPSDLAAQGGGSCRVEAGDGTDLLAITVDTPDSTFVADYGKPTAWKTGDLKVGGAQGWRGRTAAGQDAGGRAVLADDRHAVIVTLDASAVTDGAAVDEVAAQVAQKTLARLG